MNTLGYVLIAAGFLVGSYFSVEATDSVRWPLFWASLGVGILGVVLARLGHHRTTRTGSRLTAQISQVKASLESLAVKSAALNADKGDVDVYDVRHRIDRDFMADLDDFVQARESISHRYGVQAYAEVMTRFATAERYLNRCWSASADGYIDEVHEFLGKAEAQFQEALQTFRQVRGTSDLVS